jgi:hypothetical protein
MSDDVADEVVGDEPWILQETSGLVLCRGMQ